MTDLLLPGGILVASLTLTYFFCLRPMRRGSVQVQYRRGGRPRMLDPVVAAREAGWRSTSSPDPVAAELGVCEHVVDSTADHAERHSPRRDVGDRARFAASLDSAPLGKPDRRNDAGKDA